MGTSVEENMLKEEFEYFLKHQNQLVKKHLGKYVVIKNQEILGAYDSKEIALTETLKEHVAGTFLIQHCLPGEEVYTQKFYSRVVF